MTNIDITKIRPGDTVTVVFHNDRAGEFSITGAVHSAIENSDHDTEVLWVGGRPFANVQHSGRVERRPDVIAVGKHEPAEPPVGAVVVDVEGDIWKRDEEGWMLFRCRTPDSRHAWEAVLTSGVAQILQEVGR